LRGFKDSLDFWKQVRTENFQELLAFFHRCAEGLTGGSDIRLQNLTRVAYQSLPHWNGIDGQQQTINQHVPAVRSVFLDGREILSGNALPAQAGERLKLRVGNAAAGFGERFQACDGRQLLVQGDQLAGFAAARVSVGAIDRAELAAVKDLEL